MTNYTTPPPPGYPPPGQPPNQPMYTNLPPGGKRTNGWAVASLITGILGCVPFVTGALAVIFGIVGIRKARDPHTGGKGLAIAGLVLGIVSIVGWLLFGGMILALVTGTTEQRQLARQFVNDLAAGNVAAAQAHCAPGITTEQIQAEIDRFKQWGAVQDVTLVGVKASTSTTAGAQTQVAGAVTFAGNKTVAFEATLVKQGEAYKITDYEFKP